jgi:hypothetical protein
MQDLKRLAETIREYRDAPGVEVYVDQLVSELVDLKPMRYALVSVDVGKVEQLKAYMPGNYEVLGRTPIGGTNTVSVLIGGRDSCGWTLDGYVIPRLASGMYYAVEIGAVG